ncbi:MAG: MFS transporter [Candidatus Rokuibacteriota bacterium]|nr:MAG: MFS transporter [Candidatus Rokubacteria bacterium]
MLGHPAFAFLWCSRVLANVAFQMLGVAVGWQLYELTGSALDLGLVGLAQFVPMVLLTLIVGQVADRYDRRLVAATCQIVEAGAAALLVVGTLGSWLSNTSIFAIVSLVGAARAFESPATTALVSDVVARPLIARAMAWLISANQTAQIVGPALGGFLYALGPAAAYITAGALFVLAGLCAAVIRARRVARASEPLTLESVFSGVVFIRSRRVLLGTMSLDLFAVLLGGAAALLPIYARDILGTGPGGLGLLRSAPAVGALATSMFLAQHPLRRRIGPTLFRAVMAFGVATVVFGVSTNFALSLAALCVLGASDVVSVVIRATLVQIRTPDTMRGRVSAVHSLFTGTSNQLGTFESGLAAALIGTVPAVLLGGIGTIAVAALWMLLFPELRRIHAFEE